MTDYLITGLKDSDLHDRLPIETLQSDHPEQFTLFVLAFLLIQRRQDAVNAIVKLGLSVAADDPASFFNIAAIHGKPYQHWGGDQQVNASDFSDKDPKDTKPHPSRFGGYCNHGSVFFPTWHRPYVLLIEQSIGEKAAVLAALLQEAENKKGETRKNIWIDAAKALRFPFWDWADEKVQKHGLPPVLSENKIEITVPGGKKDKVDNPLSYFPIENIPPDFTQESDDKLGISYFQDWKRTFRLPPSDPNAKDSRTHQLNKNLKAGAADLRKKVALLFTLSDGLDPAKAWDEFSNHTTQSLSKMDCHHIGSLEGVHDSVHNILGGLGHMGNADYAGFDPIFFLHHCNVDRIYAFWEFCYKHYWMGSGYTNDKGHYSWIQEQGTYSQVYNEQLLPDGDLAPFRTGTGNYWAPKDARFLTKDCDGGSKFYSYPAVHGVKVDKHADHRDRVAARKKLQKHYGYVPEENIAKDIPIFHQPKTPVPDDHVHVAGYRHFVVVVVLVEHAYNGPYTFNLNYQPNKDSDPVYVGSVAVFTRPSHSPCAACSKRRIAGTTVRGVIYLDTSIVKGVIEGKGLDRPDTSDEELADAFKNVLWGELVHPSGKRLGHAGAYAPKDDRSAPFASERAPVQISLFSASAAHPVAAHPSAVHPVAVHPSAAKEGPVRFFDWKHHGDVFEGGHLAWRTYGL